MHIGISKLNEWHSILVENENWFRLFKHVYVFGSSLYSKSPDDIDILLVYEESNISFVHSAQGYIERELSTRIGGMNIDFTTLNETELLQVSFLQIVDHMQIK